MYYLSTDTHHSNQGHYTGTKKSIFLAGPSARNSKIGTRWRCDVRQYLNNRSDLVLFIPEPTDLSNNPDTDIIPFWPSFDVQFEWEMHHLSIADIIMFWVPRKFPDYPAFTTNIEFGYHVTRHNLIYGRPDDAEKCQYLDFLWKRHHNAPSHGDLEYMCKLIR